MSGYLPMTMGSPEAIRARGTDEKSVCQLGQRLPLSAHSVPGRQLELRDGNNVLDARCCAAGWPTPLLRPIGTAPAVSAASPLP